MNLTLLQDAQPSDEPLGIEDVRRFLVIDSGTENADLQMMISAARLEAENENGRELAVKQFQLTLDRWPLNRNWTSFGLRAPQYNERPYSFYLGDDGISLLDPLVSVSQVQYTQSDGTLVTLVANTDYIVDTFKHPGIICPTYGNQWPTGDLWPSSPIQIQFTAGFTPAQVPQTIKNAMLLLISEWYNNRLPFSAGRFISEVPFSVRSGFTSGKLWKF